MNDRHSWFACMLANSCANQVWVTCSPAASCGREERCKGGTIGAAIYYTVCKLFMRKAGTPLYHLLCWDSRWWLTIHIVEMLLVTPCWKVQSGLISNRNYPDLTRRSRVGSVWLRGWADSRTGCTFQQGVTNLSLLFRAQKK